MEQEYNLKSYQRKVLEDLGRYLSKVRVPGKRLDVSFREYWAEAGVSLIDSDEYLHPYNNIIKGVPRVTAKVPTAGGKTFIACNALKVIFDAMPVDKPKVVVWLVPSDTILEQTYKNLNNALHPYRQRLNTLFNASVKVVNKETALMGEGISFTQLCQQLTIFVLGVDSFVEAVRGENKLPRAYRENENLAFSENPGIGRKVNIPKAESTSLIAYIAKLNPVVIIDESHNFGSDLRVDLLNNINPCFIYELTATPKKTSNIISFVDAMKLKEENMVKLPVIVYNHKSTNDVISSAIALRNNLEEMASKEDAYIRPIVLFQAQSNIDDESINFEKIKAQLISAGIPEEQVKIKTANKNEIKNMDLMSRDCPVRYIITVNALKEGWDCPFAYILASLANRSSKIDVEQILGRILRQPHTRNYRQMYLNMGYVFTCSSQFSVTINAILRSLQNAGFSGKDYLKSENYADAVPKEKPNESDFFKPLTPPSAKDVDSKTDNDMPDIDAEAIHNNLSTDNITIDSIKSKAEQASQQFEEQSKQAAENNNDLSNEVQEKMSDKTYGLRKIYAEDAKAVRLPRFVIKVNHNVFFGEEETCKILDEEDLMKGFKLTSEDRKIIFESSQSESMMISLEERNEGEWVPMAAETPAVIKNDFFEWFSTLNTSSKVKHLSTKVAEGLSRLDNIDQGQILNYVKSVLEDKTSEELTTLAQDYWGTVEAFENKIKKLALAHKKEVFRDMMDTGDIYLKEAWTFPEKIMLTSKCPPLSRMLYTEEDYLNNFEYNVIKKIAGLGNVAYWHKNLNRKPGFCLNGFINHYPDFIVKLKSGKVLLIETKGDQLANPDSEAKAKLGEFWEHLDKSGNFRYFMTYENQGVEGAVPVNKLLELIAKM